MFCHLDCFVLGDVVWAEFTVSIVVFVPESRCSSVTGVAPDRRSWESRLSTLTCMKTCLFVWCCSRASEWADGSSSCGSEGDSDFDENEEFGVEDEDVAEDELFVQRQGARPSEAATAAPTLADFVLKKLRQKETGEQVRPSMGSCLSLGQPCYGPHDARTSGSFSTRKS